jgi:hypothetical protein
MSFEDPDDTTEAHERRIGRCWECHAKIIFLETASGKKMPCDADTVAPEDTQFDATRHRSHFADCPGAAKFRRR